MRARQSLVRRGAALVATTALATAGAAFVMGASAGAEAVERTFTHAVPSTWIVPEGVCSITVEVWGAEGGEGADVSFTGVLDGIDGDASSSGSLTNGGSGPVAAADEENASPGDSEGGDGGYATATISVTPGETLNVNIGERGGDADGTQAGEGGDGAAGNGGDGGEVVPVGFGIFAAGGGGGGASSVARGDEHLVLAGGGGGGGGTTFLFSNLRGTAGGDGGGDGEDGATPSLVDGTPSVAAEGGEAGGDGGEGGDGAGTAGTFEDGEDGGHNDGGEGGDADFQGGGGGGGGATGGGGGGGSGFTALIGGGGGGGGAGWGPEGTHFEDGANDGDGEVTISYDPAIDACVEAIVIQPRFTG